MNGWVNALWEMRLSCGREFIDRSLYYSSRFKAQNGADFNKYFLNRLVVGMSRYSTDNSLTKPKGRRDLEEAGDL